MLSPKEIADVIAFIGKRLAVHKETIKENLEEWQGLGETIAPEKYTYYKEGFDMYGGLASEGNGSDIYNDGYRNGKLQGELDTLYKLVEMFGLQKTL
jgi:hypothetical protein